MSDFPLPGSYRIVFGSSNATILKDENVLRGQLKWGQAYEWRLDYVDSDSMVMCTLIDVECGGYLGVNSIESNQAVYRVSEPQGWILRKAGDGFTISQIGEDGEYFWYFSEEGTPIILADGCKEKQSWAFMPWM